MSLSNLVSAQSLYDHLNDPSYVIIDCRFDLTNPNKGEAEYQQSHIPGAIYAHLDRDLSGDVTPETGRHPLPEIEKFIALLSTWGIDQSKHVVVYDTTGGAYASRLWWMLRSIGHPKTSLLDGGFAAWQNDHYPIASGKEENLPLQYLFKGITTWSGTVTTEEVDHIRLDPAYCLIDARTPERYQGKLEPIDPVAGHIPGAVNRFHGNNLRPDGTFKSPDTLKSEFNALLQDRSPQNVIVYCGSGVTSCHHILAMELCGLPGARLYAGSWSQWIRDPSRPIAKS
ncbi:MAG: sulfurtransferase [Anaerolineae bacterium]|nr:sulfurtransferase [Anaerolineae bacterium]